MRRRSNWLRAVLLSGALLLGGGATKADTLDPLAHPTTLGSAPGDTATSSVVSRAAKGWLRAQWADYRLRFMSPDGRVIDNANGDVSHSEGQGYGLLLALAADDPDGFALIWRWTADHLRVRPDGLFAWKWDPKQGRTVDHNDATDGDVLIAWALARAANRFGHADYRAEARRIVGALADGAVRSSRMGPMLLPGIDGFGSGDQPDGPIVNLSYWVFPALRDLATLRPGSAWSGLRQSGFDLLKAAQFGPLKLPSDWVALGGDGPAPARRYPATFGYDAVRIPLYLAWDGDAPPFLLDEFARFSPASEPKAIDVASGASGDTMGGTGFRAVFALARCAARGETIPPDLMSKRDLLYYPETLRLLSISVAQERFPRCL